MDRAIATSANAFLKHKRTVSSRRTTRRHKLTLNQILKEQQTNYFFAGGCGAGACPATDDVESGTAVAEGVGIAGGATAGAAVAKGGEWEAALALALALASAAGASRDKYEAPLL